MKFEQKVARSFFAAKNDVDAFKNSMNDWIIFLNRSNRQTMMHVRELERKIRQMEAEKRMD
jgi:hypothetical protein